MDENKLLSERKERLANFLKKDKFFTTFVIISLVALLFSILVKLGVSFLAFFSAGAWFWLFVLSALSAVLIYFGRNKLIFYPILTWVVFIAYQIRTLNLPLLRDITTGGWTLGPDLDPFLFLRWAKDIIAHGSLMIYDAMRYVPIGYDTRGEMRLLPYLIAWFHKVASVFGSKSIEQSAALFPTFMFVITVIAFFLLVRKIFVDKLGVKYASITALVASFFLSVFPVLLPRTISGIPEKESAAFFFLFMAFYLFLCAWKAKTKLSKYLLAFLAGLSTAGLALVWGGSVFIFLSLPLAVFIAFLIGQVDKKNLLAYAIWLFSSLILMNQFSSRYPVSSFIESISTQIPLAVFGLLVFDWLFSSLIRNKIKFKRFEKIPAQIVSLLFFFVIALILALVLFGPVSLVTNVGQHLWQLTNPAPIDRISITVAENRVPYFNEWTSSFGPIINGIPVTFWLFFFGSIALFYILVSFLEKKERRIATLAYIFFICGIIFSRMEPTSLFNGSNLISQLFYFGGVIVLMVVLGYYYYKYYKSGRQEMFSSLDFGAILVFAFFFFCLISVRGAIRLVMMLAPPASILAAFLLVVLIRFVAKKEKGEMLKLVAWVALIFVALSTFYACTQFYQESSSIGRTYAPSVYTQQWQKAMSWVRDNTPQNAVFGHWWDYGYWVQTIGERATVLDGGNAIGYWNYLMGRYALTGRSNQEALDFLYTHNTTYFLIDSTDIGKYPAFSSIGSDENYDRRSWITTFTKDTRQTQETKNSTMYIYTGSFALDADFVYDNNGTKIFLPEGGAGVAAIILERDKSGKLNQPTAVYVYKDKQLRLPLRYAYDGKFIDFGSGIESGIFLMPMITQSSAGVSIDKDGALLFLSNKTVKSQLARLYLYKEDNPYFKLVHSEDDIVVSQLKASNASDSDFVIYGEFRGPLRIWEINYPPNMKANPQYLNTSYPDVKLATG